MVKAALREMLLAAATTGKKERQVATIEEQVDFMTAYERKKCAALLFFGALFGFFGFGFAFLIGFWKFISPKLSEYHEIFPSGNGYFPATVSEMVHDPKDPAGKCFFAFEFIGAFLIFMSWYPWELRNVYIGDNQAVPCSGNQLSLSMFRQFVPTIGMMLVATVTSTPFAQATKLDYICIVIHLTGAVMLFGGYCCVEVFAIGYGPIPQNSTTKKTIGEAEKAVRKFCLSGIIFWYSAFCILTVVCVLPLESWGGHNDVWETHYTVTDSGTEMPEVVLVDTASGWVLWLKIGSYLSEVFCGLSLIASLLAIWYYCEERHSDLKDELLSVSQACKQTV